MLGLAPCGAESPRSRFSTIRVCPLQTRRYLKCIAICRKTHSPAARSARCSVTLLARDDTASVRYLFRFSLLACRSSEPAGSFSACTPVAVVLIRHYGQGIHPTDIGLRGRTAVAARSGSRTIALRPDRQQQSGRRFRPVASEREPS